MVIRVAELEAVAKLRDEVSKPLRDMKGGLGDFGGKLAVAGAAVTAFSGIAGRQFDAVKTKIAQATGATGEDLDGLLVSFQNLAGTISGTSNEQVAGAIADLHTKFGLVGPPLEDLATRVLKAKTAFGEFDIDTFGRSMEVFGVRTEDSAGKLDLFGAVSQDTAVPMGKLITQTQTFGPVLKNLGFDVDETAAFFGKLHESGVDVTRVMPGMNQAMRKAAKEGVTDLRGHLDGAIESIRTAGSDTGALNIATRTFGAEGAQRMVAAIRSGILPSLADLDSQYENTEGRTEAVFDETVSLGDKLVDIKNKGLALVGPFGDAAAGIGSVATTAVLAGPQIASLATTIGTKLIPFLTGPVGLVALVGTAAVIAFRDLSREAENLDKQFASVEEKQKLRTAIRDLEKDLAAAEEAAGKTERRVGTFGGVTKDVADNKVVALNYSLEQAKARLEELEAASDDAGESLGSDPGLKGKADKAESAVARYAELLAAKAIPKQRELEDATVDLSRVWRELERDIEDVQGGFGEIGPDELLPVSGEAAENAKKVSTEIQDAASSLLSTVAGDSIGGIFNSLLRGDLLGAATGAGSALLGFLTGGDDTRQAREQAQADRIRMWEEEREARIDAARDVWEEEKRLAEDALEERRAKTEEVWDGYIDSLQGQLEQLGEGFDDAIGTAFQFGLFDPVEQFLQGLPDHIDVDALRTRLQGALGDIQALTGQQSQVQGLQGFIQQHLPETGLEQFIRTGSLGQGAIDQYVAAGGDPANLEAFAEALERLNEYLELEDRDPEGEQELRDEVARTASLLDTDIRSVLLDIHVKLGEAKDAIEATKTTVLDPLKTAIAQAELWKQGAMTRIQSKIDRLIAKKWEVKVNIQWPKELLDGSRGGGESTATAMAMGGRFGAGDLLRVGEHGQELVRFGQGGAVIPNHALSGDIVVQIDGEEVARAAARHLPDVADEEGY